MRLGSDMIHTKACMQWCAYYTWEKLHSPIYQVGGMGHGNWFLNFRELWSHEIKRFNDGIGVQFVYLQELRRITFNFKPVRAAEVYSVYICLDRPLKDAIWAKRRAPHDPALETGEEVWDIDRLFQGFDYRHLNEEPINLE